MRPYPSLNNARHIPPPAIYPPTPTPGDRTPGTVTFHACSAAYTASQVCPTPSVAVPCAASYVVSLNCAVTMSTPGEDEKRGLLACPPLLICVTRVGQPMRAKIERERRTPKGTRRSPTMLSCAERRQPQLRALGTRRRSTHDHSDIGCACRDDGARGRLRA